MKAALVLALAVFGAWGCGKSADPQPTKNDFSKREPPPGWGPQSGNAPAAPAR